MMVKVIKSGTFIFFFPLSVLGALLMTGGKAPTNHAVFQQTITKASLDSTREHSRLILNQIEHEINRKGTK